MKILFVCLGNICRSPMAEFVMKDLVKKSGIEELFEIASAATSCEELGNPVYPPARQKLAEHGISCKGKVARRITLQDYAYYDYIIAMDYSNVNNLKRIVGPDVDHKISMLLDYTDHPGEVADPWYTGNFDDTWNDVLAGCKGLLKQLEKLIV